MRLRAFLPGNHRTLEEKEMGEEGRGSSLSQEIGGKLEGWKRVQGSPPPPQENGGKWKIIGEKRVEDIFPSTETGGK
jgi:hypothetical protein